MTGLEYAAPMNRSPSLPVAIGVAAVVAVVTFPLFGWLGSLPAACAAFYVVVLIGSGFRVGRAMAWGVLVAGLFVAATLLSAPAAQFVVAGGALLFVAGALVPSFRRVWFGQANE
jgi:hypothetical protein